MKAPATITVEWDMLLGKNGDGMPREVAERMVGKDEVQRWIDRGDCTVERRTKTVGVKYTNEPT